MNDSLPDGIPAFLTAAGWGTAQVESLPGDASFRRYFRIRDGEKSAMLMHAPPPGEDPEPFLRAARWLDASPEAISSAATDLWTDAPCR